MSKKMFLSLSAIFLISSITFILVFDPCRGTTNCMRVKCPSRESLEFIDYINKQKGKSNCLQVKYRGVNVDHSCSRYTYVQVMPDMMRRVALRKFIDLEIEAKELELLKNDSVSRGLQSPYLYLQVPVSKDLDLKSDFDDIVACYESNKQAVDDFLKSAKMRKESIAYIYQYR